MTERSERKQMTDPLLRKLFNKHKVIAYPNEEQRRLQQNCSLSTKSSDAVLGENAFGIQIPVLKPVSSRPRSLSTGRQRRARDDLVQSVYDRLGVSRGAIMSDTLNVEPIAAAPQRTASSSSSRNPRGRTRESIEPNEPPVRRRSLSRDGRLRSLWPPASTSSTTTSPTDEQQVSLQPNKSNRDDESKIQEPTALTQQHQPTLHRRAATMGDPYSSPSSPRHLVRSPEEAVELLSPKAPYRLDKTEGLKTRTFRNNATHIVGTVNEWKDEKKEEDLSLPDVDESLLSGPPVKDRMRAFIVPEISKAVPRKVTEKHYPPQIDIFADERHVEPSRSGQKTDDEMSFSRRKTFEPSPGNRDASTDLQSSKSDPNKLASRKLNSNQLASTFLAAINNTPTEKTISPRTFAYKNKASVEASEDDQGSVTETVSVSVLSSSASDDQLSPTNTRRFSMPVQSIAAVSSTRSVKKSHWLELRDKKLAAATSTNTSSQAVPTTPFLSSVRAVPQASMGASDHSAANIERMVDERVKARLFELERRVEEQMRTFLQRMDERVAARIADLDRNP